MSFKDMSFNEVVACAVFGNIVAAIIGYAINNVYIFSVAGITALIGCAVLSLSYE
jgi:hypothetical protein